MQRYRSLEGESLQGFERSKSYVKIYCLMIILFPCSISPPEAYDYWLDGQIRSAIKIKLSSHPCIAFELFNRSEVGNKHFNFP